MKLSEINGAFLKFARRAEANDPERLVETFVDAGPLITLLSSVDHQVIYGRRGTGKTHAFTYLVEARRKAGDIAVYLDMRSIGSNGGIYSDPSIPVAARATRLIVDTLSYVHDKLVDYTIEKSDEVDLSVATPILDRLIEAIQTVKVVGEVTQTDKAQGATTSKNQSGIGVTLGGTGSGLKAEFGDSDERSESSSSEFTRKGNVRHSVHFGSTGAGLTAFTALLGRARLWLFIDEWSTVPLELQPFLADLLRRSIFPAKQISVKIAAIEHRSRFRLDTMHGDYIGIELGADAAADVNLDDFMVFDNDPIKAKSFFSEFIFKHFRATTADAPISGIATPRQLVQEGFTQQNAFDEFVRATEGVPRDAINVLSVAAQKALDQPISIPHIRAAANTWFQRDKAIELSQSVLGDTGATPGELLHWIIDIVIGKRRARAFLLRSNIRDRLIDVLFDARVLHILKKSVSAHDQPGVRYTVYKLDYGCYVDLMNTVKAPQGLLPSQDTDGSFVEVPPDDYRSIRRAILDLDEFYGIYGKPAISTS